ncbi:MAG: flagellar protein FlaG [Deltaproteobacteria bacterium]|nr:flagellar protein FlaG [Deltaproteobacteria bacterium]
MELTGIAGKNAVPAAQEWPGRAAVAPKKEARPFPDDQKTRGQELADSGEVFANHQKAVKAVADRLLAFLDATRYSLEFIPNPENGRVTIRVLNSAGKVIRQIPPGEIDRFSLKTGSITGLLVDERLG